MLHALAAARVLDPPLIRHLLEVLLSRCRLGAQALGRGEAKVGQGARGADCEVRGSESLQTTAVVDEQSLSMTMHALASLNVGGHVRELVDALAREVLLTDWRRHSASGLANIAWSLCVLDLRSRAGRELRGWVFEGLHFHTAGMDRDSMAQVQQFLLDSAISDARASSDFGGARASRVKMMAAASSAPSYLDSGSLEYRLSSLCIPM